MDRQRERGWPRDGVDGWKEGKKEREGGGGTERQGGRCGGAPRGQPGDTPAGSAFQDLNDRTQGLRLPGSRVRPALAPQAPGVWVSPIPAPGGRADLSGHVIRSHAAWGGREHKSVSGAQRRGPQGLRRARWRASYHTSPRRRRTRGRSSWCPRDRSSLPPGGRSSALWAWGEDITRRVCRRRGQARGTTTHRQCLPPWRTPVGRAGCPCAP